MSENNDLSPDTENKVALYYQNKLWWTMQQIKFESYYFEKYSKFYSAIDKYTNVIIGIITIIATGALVSWSRFGFLQITCPSIIVIAQLARSIIDMLSLNTKEKKFRTASWKLRAIYCTLEQAWERVLEQEITLREIKAILNNSLRMEDSISKKHLEDDHFPEKKRIIKWAENETKEYFNKLLQNMGVE